MENDTTVFVCPIPYKWHEIHERLKDAWEAGGSVSDPPPIPLILAGWAFSTDVDKRNRWQNTLDWAVRHGLETLIPSLEQADQYRVVELGGVVPEENEYKQ